MDHILKNKISSPVINFLGRKKEKRIFSKPPILIGGCGRSGTTLLLAIISAHPSIYAFGKETSAFVKWIRKDGQLKPWRIDRMYRELLKAKIPKGVTRWCEKRPFNVRYIKEILEYHGPDTKFIHLVRDARAVCTSHHPERPKEYWVSIDRWVNDVGEGIKFIEHPQVLTIKYEDLILQTQSLIRQICEFIEEEMTEEMDNWYDHATVRKNKAWFEGLKNIQKESLSKWQVPDRKDRVDEIMANSNVVDLMKKLDY